MNSAQYGRQYGVLINEYLVYYKISVRLKAIGADEESKTATPEHCLVEQVYASW